jgi:hypothetical protein
MKQISKLSCIILIAVVVAFIAFRDGIIARHYKANKNLILDTSNAQTSILQLGNCYQTIEDSCNFGIVLIQCENDQEIYTFGLLDNFYKRKLTINDFVESEFSWNRVTHFNSNQQGLWTGFIMKNDLENFKNVFNYTGRININKEKIVIVGGGLLLMNNKSDLKNLLETKYLNKNLAIRTSKPIREFLN